MGTIVNIKKRIISDRPNDNGKNAEKDNQTDNIGEKVVYQLGDIGTITVDRGEWIDVVGADDLPVFSIDEMLIKEKASMLLKGKFLEEDRDFLDKIMEKDLMRSKVSPQIEYKYQNVISSDPSKINELSFIDEWIYNDDFSNMEDVYRSLQMEPSPYSDYSLGNAFTIVPLPLSERNQLDFCSKVTDFFDYQKNLDKIVETHFPRFIRNLKVVFPYIEDNEHSLGLEFIIKRKDSSDSMLIVKQVSIHNQKTYKSYFPVLFLRNKKREPYFVLACLPKLKGHKLFSGKHIPLYNSFGIKRLEKAEKIVICDSLEDADALQRQNNNNKKYAFTAFVCDPDSFDQIDFSPLNGKKIGFLVSNHSGRSLEDERLKNKELYEYLKNKRNGIKDFFFLERKVNYPIIRIESSECYYDTYTKYRPRIVDAKEYDESQFRNLFNGNNKSILEDKIEDENEKTKIIRKKSHPGRPKHHNSTVEKTLLRPFIRRGCTTVLTGDPGIGKSRFTYALAAQVAGSKKEFLTDRFWTRCLPAKGEKAGYKVVYWIFDDVDPDDILLQRNFFAKGLSKVQEKNLIIEPARSIRKRDCESLKEELKKYVSRGTPNHPVDLLIVDTLLSFARSPAKIFSAFEELVRLKDELPSLAILLIHHNSKEGNPYGGVLATNMPRVIIEMKRDNPSVTDDLGDPIMINIIKHSNEHFGIDVVPFEIRLDGDHFVVTNNSDLPKDKIKNLVIYEYKTNLLEQYSSTDIGRLLGVHRRIIEKAWKENPETETKALWNEIKSKLKEKAKAKKESTSIKRKSSVRNKPAEDFCIPDENEEDDD